MKIDRYLVIASYVVAVMLSMSAMLFAFEWSTWHLSLIIINKMMFVMLAVFTLFIDPKIRQAIKKIRARDRQQVEKKHDDDFSKYDKWSYFSVSVTVFIATLATLITMIAFFFF